VTLAQSQVTNLTTDLAAKAVLAGGNSFTGAQVLTASTDATIPLVSKAFSASQTAAIIAAQIAAGTTRFQVGATGRVSIGSPATEFGSAFLSVSSVFTTNPAIVIRGVASQTANLTEWQNSSGTVLASVIAGGSLRGFAGVYANNAQDTSQNALFVLNSVAANVGAVIRGAASQSADLLQFQTSAGGVLTGFRSSGVPYLSAIQGTDLSTAIIFGGGRSVALATGTGSFGGGAAVVMIGNATTVPTSNPTGGGILYAEGGALKWRGSSGTITTIAVA
jgi:hypothetical protein